MAMSAGVQSLLASPITGFFSRTNKLVPVKYARNASIRVLCMAEDQEKVQKEAASTPITTPPPAPAKQAPKVSTKFGDVFAFSGPAPERINGRLAMIGFVTAIGVELSTGQDVFAQLSDGGVSWFFTTTVILTIASLFPLLEGVSAESKSKGLMTANAELWNGRLAMLGLIALAVTEYVKGGALV